jgi:hypothetical protein
MAEWQGLQSRRLVEIRNHIRAGTNISHILNVKVSNQPENRIYAGRIRREIRDRLYNIQHLINVNHNNAPLPVAITWTMTDVGVSSAYYYAVNLPYIDAIIGRHTLSMLTSICDAIRNLHPEFGGQWGIAYLVTKPLALMQAMAQDDIPAAPVMPLLQQPVDEIDEEEEEDEEEEAQG